MTFEDAIKIYHSDDFFVTGSGSIEPSWDNNYQKHTGWSFKELAAEYNKRK
jgi:hypothetical protein